MAQSTDSDEDDQKFPPEKRLEAPNHRLIEAGIAATHCFKLEFCKARSGTEVSDEARYLIPLSRITTIIYNL